MQQQLSGMPPPWHWPGMLSVCCFCLPAYWPASQPHPPTFRSSRVCSSSAVSPGTLAACRDSSPSCGGGSGAQTSLAEIADGQWRLRWQHLG